MSVTKLVATPTHVRLQITVESGTANNSVTLSDMINTHCVPGPLKTQLATKTAYWGDSNTPPASTAGNPWNDPRLDFKLTPVQLSGGAITYPVNLIIYSVNYVGSLTNNQFVYSATAINTAIIDFYYIQVSPT
jgi:hypothetical protein